MAQLSDDCFAFGGPMMSVDEAVGIIAARVTPVREVETVALEQADGRILAARYFRRRCRCRPSPIPPSTAMPCASRDLPQREEAAFAGDGRVQAGASAQQPIQPGQAMRIFTGAPMPDGADTVFMQEDVRARRRRQGRSAGGPEARRQCAPRRRRHSSSALPRSQAGQRLRPQDVALAAAFGLTQIDVRRRIRVAVFSTGNELVSPGEPAPAAQLFDSNRFMLMAMLARLGCEVSDLGILRDDRASLAQGLKKVAGTHDLILTTGGVSTGEEDHVKAAVESVGTLVLWRMAIKPGRPVAMGIIGGTPFIGLPGNPVASFVTFVHVVRPTVLALSGAQPQPLVPMPVRAAFTYKKKIARREYVRVSLRKAPDGVARSGQSFRARAQACCRRWWTPTGWSNSARRSRRSNPGQTVGFLGYASLM